MTDRAKCGGEVGVNGERYEGGQFLPHTDRPKGKPRPKGSGKREVAPFVWEVPPEEGMVPLIALFGQVCWYDHYQKRFTGTNDRAIAYYGKDKAQVIEWMTRWNAGERWVKKDYQSKGETR